MSIVLTPARPFTRRCTFSVFPLEAAMWSANLPQLFFTLSSLPFGSVAVYETGFQKGVGGSVKVVTASERRRAPLSLQPGDCECIILIACMNAISWSIPPFFKLKAKHHNRAWCVNNPRDRRIGVSKNG
jgi:hypothetical protein